MLYGESFRAYPKFDEEEVFEVTGRAETVRRLEPNHFGGLVAHWANDRMRLYGDTIIPRQVFVEQPPHKRPHTVAWVYHEWSVDGSDRREAIHHIACDCSGEVERATNAEEREEIINSCPGLRPVMESQADAVNAAYKIGDVMSALPYYHNLPIEEQSEPVQDFVARSLLYLLEHDYRHPGEWLANIESGWTLTNLMANILKIPIQDVEAVAQELVDDNMVVLDGMHLTLTQRQKDEIEVARRLDAIVVGSSIAI